MWAMLSAPSTLAQPDTESRLLAPEVHVATAAPDAVRDAPALARVVLEDPSGHAFDAFFAALARTKRGEGRARVVFWGDSHTAPDLITGKLRDGLQADFGDAGPGLVLPGKPWPHHYHTRVEYLESKGFEGVRISRKLQSPIVGVAGVALSARRAASVQLRTRGGAYDHVSEIELSSLAQPGGGRVQIRVDGARVATVATRAAERGLSTFRFRVKDAPHTFELRALGDGPVTLLGLELTRARSGVIVDTLGIPGARAKFHLAWDEALYAEQLKRLSPDLFVLAYGTNEANDDDLSLADYQSSLKQTLTRIKALAPQASCLLIGPTDHPLRLEDGTLAPRPLQAQINDVQRELANEHGCAFVDVIAAMGGPLSMLQLVKQDPPLAKHDQIHLTRQGYEALGEALLAALRARYRLLPGAR